MRCWRKDHARASDGLHGLRTILLQDALHALDRIAFAIEEMADAFEQIDIVGAVIAPSTAALERPNLPEPCFPKPQDVLRNIEVLGDFADRSEGVGALVHHAYSGSRRRRIIRPRRQCRSR